MLAVPEHRGGTPCSILEPKQHPKRSSTKSHRIRQHGLKHRLQLTGRTTDNPEYISGSGLLLERLAKFAEQARVLNGDDGLRGEVPDQFNLLLVELANLLTVYGDHTNCS